MPGKAATYPIHVYPRRFVWFSVSGPEGGCKRRATAAGGRRSPVSCRRRREDVEGIGPAEAALGRPAASGGRAEEAVGQGEEAPGKPPDGGGDARGRRLEV